MESLLFDAAILVHVAALAQVAGFMIIDQLRLRLLMLIGTGLYITYYMTLDPPLWTAMFWSVVMAATNTWVIVRLVLDRSTYNLSEENLKLYKVFDAMTPGEFRRLLKIATWRDGHDQTRLTREGEAVQSLYYVMQGPVEIDKQGDRFSIEGNAFIGEVAFFLESVASASVTVAETARYAQWEHASLMELQKKDPGIRAALHSILNKDMAAKVASSMGQASIA